MRILLVDDENLLLKMTAALIEAVYPDAEVKAFTDPFEALEAAKQKKFDVVFLDVEMPGMTGLELAGKIRTIDERQNIVFLTAYQEYALESYDYVASGYIVKPLNRDSLRKVIQNLRFPVENDARIRVKCFGNFEIFYQGKPLYFKRHRAKEVFAYLVSLRGATASTGEICSILFEENDNVQKQHKYFWAIYGELNRALQECDAADVIVKEHNCYAVDPKKISCDWYEYVRNPESGTYHGEFMEQYSWAEYIKGQLEMGRIGLV